MARVILYFFVLKSSFTQRTLLLRGKKEGMTCFLPYLNRNIHSGQKQGNRNFYPQRFTIEVVYGTMATVRVAEAVRPI